MASDATDTQKTVDAGTAAAAEAPKRATTARKTAAPRTTKRPAATKRAAAATPKRPATPRKPRVQAAAAAAAPPQRTMAERAALTSVGAVLIARDTVEKAVSELRSTYTTAAARDARLKTFEQRGSTAREALERDVRDARARVEQELKSRRDRVGTAVETAQLAGATVVAKVSERVAALA